MRTLSYKKIMCISLMQTLRKPPKNVSLAALFFAIKPRDPPAEEAHEVGPNHWTPMVESTVEECRFEKK